MLRAAHFRSWQLGAALVLLTACVYLRVMMFGGFVWDDDTHITAQHAYVEPDALSKIWLTIGTTPQYYPLVFTTFFVEHKLWGVNPHGYHITNVLLHSLSVLLLWRLLARLNVRGAWLIAAIFAVHPVMVESVAWPAERKNVLSLFFSLCAAHAYLRAEMPELFTRTRWGFYLLAFVFFVAALFSKTVASTVAPALLVIVWWKRGRLTARDLVAAAPFVIAGIVMGTITAWVERVHVGAVGEPYNLSLADRVAIAGRALWFYFAKLVWPSPLIFSYPRWRVDPHSFMRMLFPISAAALVACLWFLRRRLGRGPLSGALLFAGLLFPALTFVNVYPMRFSFVADHFQYYAAIAMIALLVSTALIAFERWRVPKIVPPIAAALMLLVLSILTIHQQGIYQDLRTLWSRTVELNPSSAMANANLGATYLQVKQYPEAEKYYRAATALDPKHAIAWFDLGLVYSQQQRHKEAAGCFEKAIAAEPLLGNAHRMLGVEYQQLRRQDEALMELTRGVQYLPYDPAAHNDLGVWYAKAGRFNDAQREFLRSEQCGDYAQANYNMALIYARQGRADDTIRELQRALTIQPDYSLARQTLDRLQAP